MTTTADHLTRNDVMKRIKRSLERRSGTRWSVTGGRGTAWGWITIDAPPAERTWHRRHVGEGIGANLEDCEDASQPFGHMSPARREELGRLLGWSNPVPFQGVSIPAGSDYYREYLDRAEGRTPSVIGHPYWD